MTPAEALARARSATGHVTLYALGKGGMDPAALVPWNPLHQCDCSGFVCWALGVSRWSKRTSGPVLLDFPAEWVSTTSIVQDAKATLKGFRQVADPQPGDLIVYGDNAKGQGHVGMIATMGDGGPVSVVHCSHGNFVQHKDAIQETPLMDYWKTNGAIYVRPILYTGSA